MIYLSYLVFFAIIIFLYLANDLNLRRRDLAQARIIWFAAARQSDGSIPNDLENFATLTREHPTPELLAARDHYQEASRKLAACCERHHVVAAILRVHCEKDKIE